MRAVAVGAAGFGLALGTTVEDAEERDDSNATAAAAGGFRRHASPYEGLREEGQLSSEPSHVAPSLSPLAHHAGAESPDQGWLHAPAREREAEDDAGSVSSGHESVGLLEALGLQLDVSAGGAAAAPATQPAADAALASPHAALVAAAAGAEAPGTEQEEDVDASVMCLPDDECLSRIAAAYAAHCTQLARQSSPMTTAPLPAGGHGALDGHAAPAVAAVLRALGAHMAPGPPSSLSAAPMASAADADAAPERAPPLPRPGCQVVVLTGLPGVGKSQAMLRAAHTLLAGGAGAEGGAEAGWRYSCYVDLQHACGTEAVCEGVLRALGADLQAAPGPWGWQPALMAWLQARHAQVRRTPLRTGALCWRSVDAGSRASWGGKRACGGRLLALALRARR